MTLIDLTWLCSSLVLAAIGMMRFRQERQPLGSLVVAIAMFASACLIVADFERTAQAVQLVGIVVAGVLIIGQERWRHIASRRS